MLKLTPASDRPTTIAFLPGATLDIRHSTPADVLAARDAAADVYRADNEADPADRDPHVGTHATVAMVGAFARRVIVGWSGIGDDDGEPVEPTPERIDMLMAMPAAYHAFDALVMMPVLNGRPIGASA